jgi:hypothetical protein
MAPVLRGIDDVQFQIASKSIAEKRSGGRSWPGRAEGEGKIGMGDRAADLLDLEKRAARLLQSARDLPSGPERQGFIEEIEQFITRVSALKAKK